MTKKLIEKLENMSKNKNMFGLGKPKLEPIKPPKTAKEIVDIMWNAYWNGVNK